nr:MAG TPA: minor tail protein [Caudoviricetes sp.]
MDLFTLFGKIAVNDKEANKSIDSVTGKARQSENVMSKTFSKVGKAVAGAFTVAAVVGFEKKIVSTYSTYDDQMRKVQAVSGATGKQFEMLRGKAEELGSKTRFSATEAGQGMENLARAGWKTGEIMDGIGPVLSFATANAIDLGSAAGIVSDGLSQFGLKAKDTTMFTDVLSATAAAANTDIGLLGETFKYVGPVAGSLGYKLQDVSVAIGLMANKGIKGSQAGTSLRSAMTRLANPTGDSAKAMKKLGISLTDSTGKVKPFTTLMQDLRGKFSKLNDAQKAQYASTIFGQEAMSGMLAVVNASPEEFNKMTKSIADSNGQTQKMADTMDGGLGGAIASVKSAWEGFLIYLGKLQDTAITRALNGIATGIRNIPVAIELVKNSFNKLFAVIKSNPIVKSFIEPMKIFKQSLNEGMSVSESFHQALSDLFPNASLMVSDFIGAIEFGMKGLLAFIKGDTTKARDMFYTIFPDDVANMLKVDKIMDILENIKSRFKDTFSIIKDVVSIALDVAGAAFETLGKVWNAVGPSIVSIVLSIIKVVTKIGSIAIKVVGTTVKAIKDIVEWLKKHETAAKALGIAIGVLATGVAAYNLKAKGMSAILKVLSKSLGLTALKTKIVSAAQTVYIKAMYAAEFATKAFGIALKFLTSPIGIVTIAIAAFAVAGYLIYKNWDKIGPWLKNIWNNIKQVAEVVFGAIKTVIITIWDGIKTAITVVVLAIKFVIQTVFTILVTIIRIPLEIIKAIITTIWNYIGGYIKNALNGIKTIVTTIWNAIKAVTQSVWNAIKSVITTIWNGIKSVIVPIANAIKSVITTVWNGIKSVTSSVFNATKSVITGIWNGIKFVITSVVTGIKSKITSIWNSIKSVTTSVWNGVKSAMVTPVEGAKNTISGVIEKIKGFFSKLKLRFPKIEMPKLPEFKMEGKFSLNPPSVPHLKVKWNAEGGILTKPTIFGASNGVLQGGGEAGDEAVLPIKKLSSILADTMKELGYGVQEQRSKGDIYVTQNITSPEYLSPSETGRITKNKLRELAFEL